MLVSVSECVFETAIRLDGRIQKDEFLTRSLDRIEAVQPGVIGNRGATERV